MGAPLKRGRARANLREHLEELERLTDTAGAVIVTNVQASQQVYMDVGGTFASLPAYLTGLGFNASRRPQIATISPLAEGGSLTLTGTQLRGVSGGSGGK